MISAEFALFVSDNDAALQYYVICKWSSDSDYIKYSHKVLKLRHNIYGFSVIKYWYRDSFECRYYLRDKQHRYCGPANIFVDPYEHKVEYILMNKRSCSFGPAIVHVADDLKLVWYKNGKKVSVLFTEITSDIMRGIREIIDMMVYIQPRMIQLKYVHCTTAAQL